MNARAAACYSATWKKGESTDVPLQECMQGFVNTVIAIASFVNQTCAYVLQIPLHLNISATLDLI